MAVMGVSGEEEGGRGFQDGELSVSRRGGLKEAGEGNGRGRRKSRLRLGPKLGLHGGRLDE